MTAHKRGPLNYRKCSKPDCDRFEKAQSGWCYCHFRKCACGNRMARNSSRCKTCANIRLRGERYEAKKATIGKPRGTPNSYNKELNKLIEAYTKQLQSLNPEIRRNAQERIEYFQNQLPKS